MLSLTAGLPRTLSAETLRPKWSTFPAPLLACYDDRDLDSILNEVNKLGIETLARPIRSIHTVD